MIAVWTCLLAGLTVLLMIAHFILSNFFRLRLPGEPPIVAGHLLWGSAKDFSKNAIAFIHNCIDKHGKVFTIRLVNQYLTIIMDPHSYEAIGKDRNLAFEPIQRQVNWNVFSFILREPKRMIKETGKTVRGRFLQPAIASFIGNLDLACRNIGSLEPASEGLRHFTAKTIFDSIFITIFGRADDHRFNSSMVFKNFETFHKFFNFFWMGVPKSLFPSAIHALEELLFMPNANELLGRPDLSAYIRRAIEYMQQQNQTESDIKGHNLVYLHVNYNTFRFAFWVLSNLLEHKEAEEALLREIEETIQPSYNPKTNTASIDSKDVEGMKILDSIVHESCRLSSGVFVVRYILEDTMFTTDDGKSYLLRKGDRAAIYPPAIHKDPSIFPDPNVFKYDRFVDKKFFKDGKLLKHPIMPFGILCPGKNYALLQLKLYIITIVLRFEICLDKGQHAKYAYKYHGHEVLPPVNEVQIHHKLREKYPLFEFIGCN